MKTRRNNRSVAAITLPSPLIAVAVGVLCIAYIQLSHSASIPESGSSTSSGTNRPSRITTLRTNKPRAEVQAGRMKASDIKACISKAFCEVNSASKTPNYAVNKEFFDLMNQIHALSDEELDSGSTSVEYDDDDDEDDVSGESSEESSHERMRGYPPGPPPPPPPPGYRRGREFELGNGTSSGNGTETGSLSTTVSPSTVKKVKDKSDKKKSKKNKKTKEGLKMVKKYVNGTFVSVPKRKSRVETEEEKAEKQNYVTRKQREMGQVNDLAALIRISADIGLTLRSPRKCRTLFNKCTMTHEQIVDLFNQTLMAVTTPSSSSSAAPSSMPTTKRAKVMTTLAAAVSSASTPEASSPLTTVQEALTPTLRTTTTLLTTQTPRTTTVDDGNRSSKSRHDFSDEDVEYMTDTEIAPVQTYALFVNDAPENEETQKTAEEIVVQETFKKYANAFPVETALPGDIPSLRKRSNKNKSLKTNGVKGRSSSTSKIAKRRHASSEEDEDEEDEEDDDVGSMSVEDAGDDKNGFRIENPYPGYHVNKGGLVDDEKSVESGEPSSAALGKESNEGILPPLVQKEKPKMKEDEEDDEDEDSEESAEADLDVDDDAGLGLKGYKGKGSSKLSKSTKRKSGSKKSPSVALDEEESSEEDEVEAADDHQQSPPPWNPVYQMYMTEKKNKQGYKKKQKGPYKGGEGPYDDSPSHHAPQSAASSLTNFLTKPWGGGANSGSQEIPGGPAAPIPGSHEGGGFPNYHGHNHNNYHGGHGGPPGGPPAPYGNSQETGGASEPKPGFFQSIMSWFTGGKGAEQGAAGHQGEGAYGAGPMHPYAGGPGGQHQHVPFGHHGHGSIENDEPEKEPTGSPWPSQPDPAGVGHFGQSYSYRGYRHPQASSEEEEDEELIDEPTIISKKSKKTKRRYRGRSDSIITSSPKKSSNTAKKPNSGPPPPVVVVPKDSKSVAPLGNSPVGIYEPNHQYEKLIQADGGLTTGSGKKPIVISTKENKRAKKAAVKPKKQQKKKSQKQSQRATSQRTSRESAQDDDDDEMYSSEEIFNQQIAKLKSGGAGSGVTLGAGSSGSGGMNAGGNNGNGGNGNKNDSPNKSGEASFPSYFESMFGTEEKDKYKIKGKDDGSLLYGFDSLSSQLSPNPLELPIVGGKKKVSSYKVNKNKKKKKNGAGVLGQPVKFNNKEVIESSEEEGDKRKKRK